ncbi:hypothetical protein GPECTOR_7g1202 [Gonium pectorale]|uniref:Protein-serine/threonine kinase n=1 Tax=Gonium pectorale TaxID=33097 RepID=A0A150GUE4_GONPE|nr:hypothetical protein GPECTOR_7g1202 [Gonium pectorale]|eukprot:KXZ53308.1 hypothetical protein GPECTOR_7g1202 [Gonium pectorale]
MTRRSKSPVPFTKSHTVWLLDGFHYAAQEVEVLSLKQMLSFGHNALDSPDKILKSARYVQRELPKRLARRLLDLQLLPYIVVTNPHIKKVYNQYYVSFETLRRLPTVKSLEDNADFSQLLRQHLDQHAPMLDCLATGLRECKSKELVGGCLQMDSFFDSMLRSRISRRVIAEQHLHLGNKRPAYIGTICTDLDVHESIDFAVQKTRQVCMETYGTAPDVVVSGDPQLTIPYIPAHLDYMLYELLKNAMRYGVSYAGCTGWHPLADQAQCWSDGHDGGASLRLGTGNHTRAS